MDLFRFFEIDPNEVINFSARLPKQVAALHARQARVAGIMSLKSHELLEARRNGTLDKNALASICGGLQSRFKCLLMASCFTKNEIVEIMGVKDAKALGNYQSQLSAMGFFAVTDTNGVYRYATADEVEQKSALEEALETPYQKAQKCAKKLRTLRADLAKKQERLSSLASRLVAAGSIDDTLQLQHDRVQHQISILEIDIKLEEQKAEALPSIEEATEIDTSEEPSGVDTSEEQFLV